MLENDLTDTIASIATPVGESGIGIVRISGKQALAIADKIFVSKDDKKPSEFKTYTVHYGWITKPNNEITKHRDNQTSEIIDEVILTVMRAPKSYTKEDVVEINCHGGIVALRRVLDLVLENGCRLAQPGEFTKRAFLNGRIDLAQAEAVLDIIRAKTDAALKIGSQQLRGALSGRVNKIRDRLLKILSVLEANIDFCEEEICPVDREKISRDLAGIIRELKLILDNSRQGRIMREGIQVVICGRPNVGKSSLLNALLRQERSIVTPIAGTTRDTIEEIIDIKGIPVKIVDTAGIIEPKDLIAKKAVARSRAYIRSADLVIILFDASQKLTKDDRLIIRRLRGKTVAAVINKIDLKPRIEKGKILRKFNSLIEISAKRNKNIDLLEKAIVDLIYQGKVSGSESVIVANRRHIELLNRAQKLIADSLNSLDNKLSEELIASQLSEALGYLDELLGKKFREDLLTRIFSEFCIGK